MRTSTRRTLCLLTAIAVTASSAMFTACKSQNGGNAGTSQSPAQTMSAEQVQKTLAFKTMNVKSPEGKRADSLVAFKNGLYYAITSSFKSVTADDGEMNYESLTSMMVFDESGTLKTEIPLTKMDSTSNSFGTAGEFTVDDAGNITISINEVSYDPNTYESDNKSFIKTFDASGNEIASIDTSAMLADDGEGGYLSGWVADNDGNLYLMCNTKIVVLDKSGNQLFEIKGKDADNWYMSSLILTNEGKAAYVVNEYSDSGSTATLYEIDLAAKGNGKTYNISSIMNTYSLYNGSGDYLFYTRGDTGVLGVKPDMTVDNVLNLLSLGVDSSEMSGFYVASDGSFLMSSYGMDGAESSITKIYPVDPSEIKEKKIINLGCFSTDWSIRSLIADFNKTNEEYTILVNSYTDNNDTSNYEAAQTEFNNQLLAGNVPDILLIDGSMPYESYASKGLFTDLYTLIDNDPEMNRDAFLSNVLTALESNGKLYSICSSFSVQTYAAKSSTLGGKENLYLTDAVALASTIDGGAVVNYDTTRESFVQNAIAFSDFIDYDGAKCDFDNDAFKAILEYSKGLPEEIDYDALVNEDPGYWENHQMDFANDKALVKSVYLYSTNGFDYSRGELGSDFAFTNFPTDRPATTGLIETSVRISISNNSAMKDGAWQFIKYCLGKTVNESHLSYYDNDNKYVVTDDIRYEPKDGMPILKKDYDLLLSHALDPKYYYDSDGKKVEEDNTFYLGGDEIKLPPMTQADVDMLDKMFKTPTKRSSLNSELMTIINDEIASYYSGNKSVDETVQLIQSRANIYMSEHY